MAEITPSTWQPQEAKLISRIVKFGLIGLLITAASIAVKTVIPTVNDAILLLRDLFANGTSMLIAGGVLLFAAFLFVETFSKTGRINKLFAQAYSSFINKLTFMIIDFDPITPLTDQKAEMLKQQTEFSEGRANFDGLIASLEQSRDNAMKDSLRAEKTAKAAKDAIDKGNPDMKVAYDENVYAWGSYRDAAANFQAMVAKLVPVRARLKELDDATATLIRKLNVDIDVLTKTWAAQKNMASMDAAARKLLTGTEKRALAQTAQDLIQNRYAEQMGRLRNLAESAKPLVQSLDLERGSFSQELLDKWNEETSPNISVVTQQITHQPGSAVPMAAPTGSFAQSLLRK